MKKHICHNFVQALATVVLAGTAHSQITYRTVALSDAEAPGARIGAVFQVFSGDPNITSSGDIAARAGMAPGLGGVDSSNDTGLWRLPRGGLIAREGDPAPDTSSGALYSNFNFDWAIATDSLAMVFKGRLATGTGGVISTTDEGLWRWSPEGVRLIAREGDPVPDVPGATFLGDSAPLAELWAANSRGVIAFTHILGGVLPVTDEAIWIGDEGATTIVAREGDLAPGAPDEALFLSTRNYAVFQNLLLMNDIGDLVFGSELSDPKTNYSGSGLFFRDGTTGAIAGIGHTGAQAPGTAPETVFESGTFPFPLEATINNNQLLAIAANLEVGTGDAVEDNNAGIWTGTPGDLQLLVREGDRAPGTPESVVFNGFDKVAINDSGMVLFRASVRDTKLTVNDSNRTGIWLWSPESDQIDLVFRAGGADPDDPNWILGSSNHFAINDRGLVTILSTTEDPLDPFTRKNGAYSWRPGRGLTELLEEGDVLEVAPNDFRQVQYLNTFSTAGSGMSEGQPRILSNRAELVLPVNFSDLSQAIIVVEIDEPLLPPVDPEWKQPKLTKTNTADAELEVRVGDIDNLGFGWPEGFDPFSGVSTPSHTWPWSNDPADPAGTDRIMVVSSHTGTGQRDGYSTYVDRVSNPTGNLPDDIVLSYDTSGINVTSARLQIFVDDFQALIGKAAYRATINRTRAPFLENAVNRINQTAPVGKLLDLEVPAEFLSEVASGRLSILFDDPVSGAGEGYAIDFVRLLVNPVSSAPTGSLSGTVTAAGSGAPIANARITAAGQETFSDASGNYILRNLPVGDVIVKIFATGYQTATGTINVVASQTTENVNVALPASPIAPESDASILGISFGGASGEDLEFTFQGTPGSTYFIEKSENLEQWRKILEDIPGNVNPIMISDPTPGQRSPHAYYRVGNQ